MIFTSESCPELKVFPRSSQASDISSTQGFFCFNGGTHAYTYE